MRSIDSSKTRARPAFLGLLVALLAAGCPSREPRDPMNEARALFAIQAAIECAYPRSPYDPNPRPDAKVFAIDREAVSFSWFDSTEIRTFMKLRYPDVIDVNLIADRRYPAEDRVAMVVAVRNGSPSAQEIEELGAARFRRLFERIEISFPARPRVLASEFRDAVFHLSVLSSGPADRFTPLVGSPSESPGFGHTRVEGRPITEPDPSSPAAPGNVPSRRIDEPIVPSTSTPTPSPEAAPEPTLPPRGRGDAPMPADPKSPGSTPALPPR